MFDSGVSFIYAPVVKLADTRDLFGLLDGRVAAKAEDYKGNPSSLTIEKA